MNKTLKEIINQDLYRYGYQNRILTKFMLPLELKWQVAWRKATFYSKKSFFGNHIPNFI